MDEDIAWILAGLAPYGVFVVLTIIPSWQLLRRVGLSPWWALLSFAHLLGVLIILWMIAYRKWPKGVVNA